MKTLKDLLTHQILDLHSAEKQLLEALPDVASLATDQELSDAITTHYQETKEHVKRLEKACELL